jgi:hypothetical protein
MMSKTNALVLGGATIAAGVLLAGCASLTSAASATSTATTPPLSTVAGGSVEAAAATTARHTPKHTPAAPLPSAGDVAKGLRNHLPGGWQYSMFALTGPMYQGSGDYQAATYDQNGHIAFWQYAPDTNWTKVGDGTYPTDMQPYTPVGAKVTSGQVNGMANATFIVTGMFSNDGGVNAIAYTSGNGLHTPGWGAVKAKPDGNLAPSGASAGSDGLGLSNEFDLVNGELETADCSSTLPMAECGGNQRVLKFWAWHEDKQEFFLTHTAGLSH